jgi:hypothetical protein
MPNLVIFAACERAMIEEGTNSLSLIALLQNINVGRPSPSELAMASPVFRWCVVGIWHRTPSDSEHSYEQRVTLTGPDGVLKLEAFGRIDLTKEFARTITMVNGFPTELPGSYELAIWLREDEGEWKKLRTYPLFVTHKTASALVEPPAESRPH